MNELVKQAINGVLDNDNDMNGNPGSYSPKTNLYILQPGEIIYDINKNPYVVHEYKIKWQNLNLNYIPQSGTIKEELLKAIENFKSHYILPVKESCFDIVTPIDMFSIASRYHTTFIPLPCLNSAIRKVNDKFVITSLIDDGNLSNHINELNTKDFTIYDHKVFTVRLPLIGYLGSPWEARCAFSIVRYVVTSIEIPVLMRMMLMQDVDKISKLTKIKIEQEELVDHIMSSYDEDEDEDDEYPNLTGSF